MGSIHIARVLEVYRLADQKTISLKCLLLPSFGEPVEIRFQDEIFSIQGSPLDEGSVESVKAAIDLLVLDKEEELNRIRLYRDVINRN